MPFLQGSGAISINDIRNLFGGPGSPSLANYYRGGSYIPSTKTVTTTTREPSSGEYFSFYAYMWRASNSNTVTIRWANVVIGTFSPVTLTSVTVGGATYYRGSYYGGYGYYGGDTGNDYRLYRVVTSTTTTSINTNIPTSGTISLSQFYSAEKP